MMIHHWIVSKRLQICISCSANEGCIEKWGMFAATPKCPLGKIKSADEEIAERAWPLGADAVSGCCDSARNYLSHRPSV